MDSNDRRTKKWTSLMIPDHVKEVWKEDEREGKKILDEQKVEEIAFALQELVVMGYQ
ncbi:YolD-like family protein [Halobacillus shinanisalinarum]|uniref:YolD-like family protein n=1 Tax=Halobacillus shinanisalinarum TaxID=2932258 RepID=A0ABY4GXD7_9BACI|nr:YolD-like family protein [Halobacillus shinanisalinarum]UOQ91477.1 YolD-like family protein [Halobacillus shinanisalinarum]